MHLVESESGGCFSWFLWLYFSLHSFRWFGSWKNWSRTTNVDQTSGTKLKSSNANFVFIFWTHLHSSDSTRTSLSPFSGQQSPVCWVELMTRLCWVQTAQIFNSSVFNVFKRLKQEKISACLLIDPLTVFCATSLLIYLFLSEVLPAPHLTHLKKTLKVIQNKCLIHFRLHHFPHFQLIFFFLF